MPKVIYDSKTGSRFGVPEGSYVCKFLGTADRPPFEGPSKFQKTSDEPRLEWQFEVTQGNQKGQLVTQTTGNRPAGAKSGFVKMVKGLMGRLPTDGEEIDTDTFVGKAYQVEVEVNPASDQGNLHIAFLKPLQGGGGPVPAPAPPKPVATPSRPSIAPPPGTPAQLAEKGPDPGEKFELWTGKSTVVMSRSEILAEVGGDPNVLGWFVRKPGNTAWTGATVESEGLGIPF